MSRREQDSKVGWPWIVAIAVLLAVLVFGAIYYLRMSVPSEDVVETERLEVEGEEEEPADTEEDS